MIHYKNKTEAKEGFSERFQNVALFTVDSLTSYESHPCLFEARIHVFQVHKKNALSKKRMHKVS
jgi:hypothetical protein